jgi:hypothetical protein
MSIPQTFLELYLEGCRILKDEPERITMYQELDKLWSFIESHPEKDNIKYALSSQRVCIVIPRSMFLEKRLPPDGEDEDGQSMMFSSPGYDHYFTLLIDEMKDTSGLDIHGSIENLNCWKLNRLMRVVDLGWEAFTKSYLAPLYDREKYLKAFMAAK